MFDEWTTYPAPQTALPFIVYTSVDWAFAVCVFSINQIISIPE